MQGPYVVSRINAEEASYWTRSRCQKWEVKEEMGWKDGKSGWTMIRTSCVQIRLTTHQNIRHELGDGLTVFLTS